MSLAMFVLGFGFAFYYGWKLTVILLGVMPFAAFAGIGFAASLESGTTQMMRAYAQSAGYAD